jgi:hypothetical protein
MKHIYIFIFSLFLSVPSVLIAQETREKDSISVKKERFGLRLGVDLFKLTRAFYEKDYKGLELTGDFRVSKKHYVAAEIGTEDKTVDEPNLNFTTSGSYIRIGFDYNTFENWLDMENQIYVGMRYGFSSFSQQLNSYSLYNIDNYFPSPPIIEANQEFKGLTAHWVEVVVGVKAELFSNLYAGFSFRLNRMINQKQPQGFENLYIPGFNRTYGGSDFGVGFNYTISYFLPIYKKASKVKKK